PADYVVCDSEMLKTLSDRDYLSGLAEIVKCGFIGKEELFTYLKDNITGLRERSSDVLTNSINGAIETKLHNVSEDLEDKTGRRAILEVGQAVGRAIEKLAGYGTGSRGEAGAMGMSFALWLGEDLGFTEKGLTTGRSRMLKELNRPENVPNAIKSSYAEI